MIPESYNCVTLAANAAQTVANGACVLGGFFATTAGNVQIRRGPLVTDAVAVDTFPVVSGVFYVLPFAFGAGCYVALTGGAAGAVAIV